MRKLILLALFTGLIQLIHAQDNRKEIDLTTAVLQQYRSLAPETVRGFKFLPGDEFLYYGESGEILIKNFDGDIVKTITLSEVNASLKNANLDTLSRLSVLGVEEKDIMLIGDHRVYAFDKNGNEVSQILVYPEEAVNSQFHLGAATVAYTKGPNVFVESYKNVEKKVTDHSEESQISAGVAIHRSEFGITKGLFWSEGGERLGFYEMDESMVTDYPLAHYTTIPGEVNTIKYPMAGQTSHTARVGIYDLDRDTTIYLQVEGPKDQYLTNLTFSPDANKVYLAVVNREQNRMDLNRYNSQTGEFEKTLFTETHDKYVEPERGPIFLEDGRFLWFSERDGFDNLYLYSSEGELERQITSGEYDVLEYHGETDGDILVEVADGLMSEAIALVSLSSGKMKKLTQSEASFSIEFDPESGTALIREQSMTIANRIYLMNLKGKEVLRLVDAEDPLNAYQKGDIELPVLYASDGTALQARLIKPYDFDPERKYPVLVYLYGGPHAQLIRNNRTAGAPLWMFHAANRGYVVFTVDGRGSAHRGLDFEQATFRNMGEVEMEDQLTGVNYLKTLSYVDSSRMAVHGWSYGGFMTTSLMLKHPGVFDVGVAGGPVTDWTLYEVMYTERYMDTPDENPEGFEKAKLNQYVENLEGKLLLIHGLDDDIVVPQHSYSLLKSFVDAGVQVDFFTYPGHRHNVRGKDRVHLMTKVLDYVDLHLK
jgi:dipeptidyl-peptidase-4